MLLVEQRARFREMAEGHLGHRELSEGIGQLVLVDVVLRVLRHEPPVDLDRPAEMAECRLVVAHLVPGEEP